jgi:NAD(P)-dependent dehydrogenase (short-subunit alcohol dehydrogenase family)
VAAVLRRHGRLDIWVNDCSQQVTSQPAEAAAPEWWAEGLSVVTDACLAAQAAAVHMLAAQGGVILNLVSTRAVKPDAGRAAGNVAEAAVDALTRALGVEWAARGVRVVGAVLGEVGDEMGDARDGGERGAAVRRTPLRRVGTPQEVAQAVLFLVSDEASYVTAESLRVDGGRVAYQLF